MVNVKDYIPASEIENYKVKKDKMGCECPFFDNEDQKKITFEYIDGLLEHILAAKLILDECDPNWQHYISQQIIHQILYFETRETINIIGQVSMKYCIPFDFLSPFFWYYSAFL